MSLVHICSGKCYNCTDKTSGPDWREKGREPVTRTFELVRALFTGTPRQQAEVMDCWECRECRSLVPHSSWKTYQETGNVIVPARKRGR